VDLQALGAACRDHGVLLVVDAIQSIGHVPLDVTTTPVDVVATGGHKWLCGPFGTVFAYVREEVRERLDPAVVGWWSMRASRDIESVVNYSWELVSDASQYEVGTLPLHDVAGFAASLELIAEGDPGRILGYVDTLLDPLRNWLLDHPEVHVVSPVERERRSGILAFRTPDPPATYRALRAAGSVVSVREGAIRVAAHLYNVEEDIAVVLGALEHCARRGWA
jgi:cysteine desulfurase / selenocysteine lyase